MKLPGLHVASQSLGEWPSFSTIRFGRELQKAPFQVLLDMNIKENVYVTRDSERIIQPIQYVECEIKGTRDASSVRPRLTSIYINSSPWV